jgi:hypothetical protein
MQLTFGSQCVSQISTSDSSVVVNENINPGAQGVSFQSNVPITITIHFSCNIQMMHMCIPSSTTNVGLFSYTLKDIYNNPISTGVINLYETDGCIPPPLNIAITITQLIITISQTKDGQSPRNVVLDLQGSHVPTVSRKYPFVVFLIKDYQKNLITHFFLRYLRCQHNHHSLR